MSEKANTSPGLLSKVVRFVRNPTVSWTDLDSIDADRESQYSKQVLKEMIERKRRNDFVRRREFDQLRKLRQRDALAGQRVEDPAARPSFFQSSLTSPDDRAVTIKKIDEIEAQMSMQWWKSKQNQSPPAPVPAESTDPSDEVAAHHLAFEPTAPLSLPSALEERGPVAPLFESEDFVLSNLLVAGGSADTDRSTGPPQADTAQSDAAPAQLQRFVHDPDLEEAAILFANRDLQGAEASLQSVLAQRAGDSSADLLEIWMTLFDLYRATGQQAPFEAASITFAARFDRSAPLWFSLPAQLGVDSNAEPLLEEGAGAARRNFTWNAPPNVTVQTVANMRAALGRASHPWTLIWTRLSTIDANAVSSLADEFTRWAAETGQIVFSGADHLRTFLEAQTHSGNREQSPEWWRLRMAALRLMGQPDEFEMVALDYCVTYEVSPPSWQSASCIYQSDSTADEPQGTAEVDSATQPGWDQSSVSVSLSALAFLTPLPDGLMGELEGDATVALDEAKEKATSGVNLQVHCHKLIRIDFSAAGSVLNWTADQQAQGRVVQFLDLHRLAAVFFNVVGISEHGWVVARSD